MNPNFSYATSLPAYLENKEGKKTQCELLQALIAQFKETSIKQLSRATGIPDAIVSARLSDLIKESKIEYSGFINFDGRKRKRIIVKVEGTGQLTIQL